MMFGSGSASPYSSFFMSGFQHASHSSPVSPSSSVDEDDWFMPDFRRRGSLPTEDSASVEKQLSVTKPKSTRERSWLSLDLASQRTSSIRSMPLPKPVPSMCLPALPTLSERTPSPVPSSVLMPLSTEISPRNSQLRTSCASSVASKASTRRVSFLPIPPSSPKTASYASKPSSVVVSLNPLARSNSTVTKKTSSTVSTRYRRARRTDALARLEGRASHWEGRFSWSPVAARKNSVKRSYNFMSMSDDEADSDVEESFFDIGFDFSSSDSHHRIHSSPDVPISPTDAASVWTTSPISPASQQPPMPSVTLSRALTHKRQRSHTLSQLLPGLTSFIDLDKETTDGTRRDNKRWRGRSFIEIASL
ncbi:hypothetical protein E1B28_007165 [Marasmius oreades]|uniref:Uncharacterized protein n=1 Tax=Marasmius oreades TaxID=181124 RepID=A0A9P7S1T3_9AGAR|nr:uncharacterized protein E1B28_007165 [Marasmius oreades]KAG7093490.1 hypothetical protein E1B28_007165 [Marasmius oreades]